MRTYTSEEKFYLIEAAMRITKIVNIWKVKYTPAEPCLTILK